MTWLEARAGSRARSSGMKARTMNVQPRCGARRYRMMPLGIRPLDMAHIRRIAKDGTRIALCMGEVCDAKTEPNIRRAVTAVPPTSWAEASANAFML